MTLAIYLLAPASRVAGCSNPRFRRSCTEFSIPRTAYFMIATTGRPTASATGRSDDRAAYTPATMRLRVSVERTSGCTAVIAGNDLRRLSFELC